MTALAAWQEHQRVGCHVCADGESIDREMFEHGYAAALEARPTRTQIAKAMYDVFRIESPRLIPWGHRQNGDNRKEYLRQADAVLALLDAGDKT